jgi:hypothetical protein
VNVRASPDIDLRRKLDAEVRLVRRRGRRSRFELAAAGGSEVKIRASPVSNAIV